jgi:glyoxylase-like metal-dependent hydrolase (beta-lactamase superfamily II)
MKITGNIHGFLWSDPMTNNCNCYFVDGEKKILLDPGHSHLFEHVIEGLQRLSFSLEDIDLIIITHGHPDHMEAVRLFEGPSTLIAAHKLEVEHLNRFSSRFRHDPTGAGFKPHILLEQGDLKAGGLSFKILHTPGHSPGSICVYDPINKALFTGDLVFYQGVGRADLSGGNGEDLQQSLKKISDLDVEHLLPGHGQILSGRELVKNNFREIEVAYYAYL